jgi:DEAD/DEAH box helicase domain-containing protein
VGRNGQESAVVLVAGEDALDHYFINHPELFQNKARRTVRLPVNW